MTSLQKKSILVWTMTMTMILIIIMMIGNKNSEVLQKVLNSDLRLDFLKRTDSKMKLPLNSVEDEIILKIGLSESAQAGSFIEHFSQSIKEQSEQKLKVELVPFFQKGYIEQFVNSVNEKNEVIVEHWPRLVNQDISTEVITSLSNGEIALTLLDLSQLAKIVPEFSFLQVPRLFNNVDEVNIIWNSEVGDYLRSKAFEKGLTLLAFEPSGFSHFFTSQPIVDFQQIQNNVVGVSAKDFAQSIWQGLNINTLILEPEQIIPAVADGAIHTYSTTMDQIAIAGSHQPLKFCSNNNFILSGRFVVMNQHVLSTLPKSLQTVLIQSAKNNLSKNNAGNSKQKVMAALETTEFKRYDLPEQVQNKLTQLAQSLKERNRERWGNYLIEMTNQLLHKGQSIDDDQILIGLDADLTMSSSQSGIAIKRGIELALDEINQSGGVLGKKLVLKSLDHSGFSDQGIRNLTAFAKEKNLVAVVGGLHSPVAIAEQEIIHQEKIVYLDPWAAATAITENGYSPNYSFRLSVKDEYAGPYLVSKALEQGYKKIAFLYENTAWGRGNLKSVSKELDQPMNDDVELVDVQSFSWGIKDFNRQLAIFKDKGADVIILVANAPEGAVLFQNMALRGDPIPVISHWGITGGQLDVQTREAVKKLNIKVLQTFSLTDSESERVLAFKKRYFERYPTKGEQKIIAESGTAHAYDLVFLLIKAIEQAQSINPEKVRESLEHIDNYSGLIKTYFRPFTELDHDALGIEDLNLHTFSGD